MRFGIATEMALIKVDEFVKKFNRKEACLRLDRSGQASKERPSEICFTFHGTGKVFIYYEAVIIHYNLLKI
ncbi:MAG: hypothetical protein KAT54_03360, partial [Candidatus Marinimicrobia bacterium]|nr:hypothetical protein [Candidatus Neomarinimicrobiota bacterium]